MNTLSVKASLSLSFSLEISFPDSLRPWSKYSDFKVTEILMAYYQIFAAYMKKIIWHKNSFSLELFLHLLIGLVTVKT